MSVKWEEMALVGRIARAHGIHGRVIINSETDFPRERFRPGAELFVHRSDRVEAITVTTVRFAQNKPVIGILGIADMNGAAALAGLELRVPAERLAALPADTFYRHDLVGCAVETGEGERVGVVGKVEGPTEGSRLVVDTAAGEVLVPLVEEICTTIDPASRRIVIDPPEGLLELNRARRT